MDFSNFGQILLRMVVIFAIALIVVRLMGNRTVGQFSPFDFVLMVGIGDIVGNIALDRNEGILTGAEALVGLFLLQQVLAWSSLKSPFLRKLFEGVPVVLIENGRIIRENLVKTQFNYDDLRQELHKQGLDFTNLQDIKSARLESCGQFSVIRVPEMEPFTKRDFNNFIHSVADNPLSPQGTAMVRLEQMAEDIKVLADFVRTYQMNAAPAKTENEPTESVHH